MGVARRRFGADGLAGHVHIGEGVEPARVNAAICGLSTFLSSRKIAEDPSDRT
jgi:hypothetical protein